MSEAPIRAWLERDETLLRLRLARPKGNIIDRAMIGALRQALETYAAGPSLKAVLLDHEGPHFSFGASVQEHMPDQLVAMLGELHGLLRVILEYPAAVVMAVRGQCLGGGLELAAAGSMILAASDAWFGQPEIKLGTFAPAGSCLLGERLSQGDAEEMLLSGRSLGAEEALRLGLVQQIAADPAQAALDWFDTHLAPKSAAALRIALKAVRQPFARRVIARFAEVEALCADELMATHDMVEGVTSFLEKREPVWRHR